MKNLIYTLCLLLPLGLVGQTFLQRTNGSFTPIDPFLSVPRALYIPKVCDTINNTLSGGKDSVGAIVFDTCNHKFYIRDVVGVVHRWRDITSIVPEMAIGKLSTYITDDEDYEIDIFPDLQNMTKNSPQQVYSMFDWVVANRSANNIRAVIQCGDLTEDDSSYEWRRIDTAFKKLDAIGLPYMAVIGNHDYDHNNYCIGHTTNDFNATMGPARYAGKPFYGGNYGGKNDDFFINFTAGSIKYRVIGLEHFPSDTAIAWAKTVLDSTAPDTKVIFAVHGYISAYGEKAVDTTLCCITPGCEVGNPGQSVWDKLFRLYPQACMVVSGHYIFGKPRPEPPVVQHITQSGLKGNIVEQFVTNYQSDSLDGHGYFMRLKFRPRAGKMDVSFFSSVTGVNDPRHSPYTLDYPGIPMKGAVGVSSVNGSLNVAGNARIDSGLYVTQLSKNKLVITGKNGKIDTLVSTTAVLDFTNTAPQTSTDLTISYPGAAIGDFVLLTVPNVSVNPNSSFTAWVSAVGIVTVRFNNYSSGSIDPVSGSFRINVSRF